MLCLLKFNLYEENKKRKTKKKNSAQKGFTVCDQLMNWSTGCLYWVLGIGMPKRQKAIDCYSFVQHTNVITFTVFSSFCFCFFIRIERWFPENHIHFLGFKKFVNCECECEANEQMFICRLEIQLFTNINNFHNFIV